MQCTKCGYVFSADSKFCTKCGIAIVFKEEHPFERTTGLPAAALISGLLSILCVWVASIPAIIAGIWSLKMIAKGEEPVGKKGFALAGILLGIFTMLASVAALVGITMYLRSRGQPLPWETWAAGTLVAIILFFVFVLVGILLGIKLIIEAYFVDTMRRIPVRFRQMEPLHIWLVWVPLFGIVWSFFAYPKLSQSMKLYLNSLGRQNIGDCGHDLAIAFCVCAACQVIPYAGALAGIGAFVLFIMYLIKMADLRKQLPNSLSP